MLYHDMIMYYLPSLDMTENYLFVGTFQTKSQLRKVWFGTMEQTNR